MRRPRKRTVLILAALLLLVGITVVVWEVADWPPPRLILKYGFPPTGGPTGRTKVIEGVQYVELAPGTCRVDPRRIIYEGNLIERVGSWLGLRIGRPPEISDCHCPGARPRWIEVPRGIWLSAEKIPGFNPFIYAHREAQDRAHRKLAAVCKKLQTHAGGAFRIATYAELSYACGFPPFRSLEGSWHYGPPAVGRVPIRNDVASSMFDSSHRPYGYHLIWMPQEDE